MEQKKDLKGRNLKQGESQLKEREVIDTDIQISTVNVIQYMHGSLQGRIKHRQGKKMD